MSKSDFGHDQGGIQSSQSTEFDPVQDGTPSVGFSDAPKGKVGETGPGQGIGNSRRGIH